MYQGYRHQISTRQLIAQRDQLARTNAKRIASLALDLNPDFPKEVNAEMKIRVSVAMAMIDEWDFCNDNGVGPEIITAPMPYTQTENILY